MDQIGINSTSKIEEINKAIKVKSLGELTNDLIERAKIQGNAAPKSLKTSVELYYISRYFLSLFESNSQVIPIQIWNEFRSTLDHFMRHTTEMPEFDFNGNQEKATTNLKRMEGHLQRAALDAMKFVCNYYLDEAKRITTEYSMDAQKLADNSMFLVKYRELLHDTQALFTQAKVYDDAIGKSKDGLNGGSVDNLISYIAATYSAAKLGDYVTSNIHGLQMMESTCADISKKSRSLSATASFFIGAIASLFIAVIYDWAKNESGFFSQPQNSAAQNDSSDHTVTPPQ